MTMEETIRRLGDAELEIMQAVWAAGEPVSSTYVQQALRGRRDGAKKYPPRESARGGVGSVVFRLTAGW